ncbi:chemotaxis protein [Bifidobacterium aemilianum]|uniref:Chemotaxis protein n=1 Tax=Bifidobacterium aemilianum TaxID=2493120 RepID=A0A366KA81_9BIFI|nr:DUF4012 domain-containing protein [Bifidobacterium aemilianum]RBP98509.1 chemotaxis protein [Bifidobacterium aemilianum]
MAFLFLLTFCLALFYGQVQEVKKDLNISMASISQIDSSLDVEGMSQVLRQLEPQRQNTQQAREITQGFIWKLLVGVPVVGDDVRTMQGMASTMDSLMADALPELSSALGHLQGAPLSTVDGQINLTPLLDAGKSLSKANTITQEQNRALKALPRPRLSKFRQSYEEAAKRLDYVSTVLDDYAYGLQVLPGLLGQSGPRTYAIVAMTPAEARSAGGLVGAVGTADIDTGRVSFGDFRSNTEYISAGQGAPTEDEKRIFSQWGPLKMSLDVRDIAAVPDTQRTAEQMRNIWGKTPWGKQKQLDGVILVDPVCLQEMIKVSGSVTMPDGQVLTGIDTAEFLLNTIYKKYTPEQQDVYFGQVARQSMTQVFSGLDAGKVSRILRNWRDLSLQRHFAIYMFDRQEESVMEKANLTAHTPDDARKPTVGVYVTEQNSSKMDWYVHRSAKIVSSDCQQRGPKRYHFEYTMTNTLKDWQADLVPTYVTGQGQAGQPRRTAVEKTLIYAPAGGQLSNISVKGDADPVSKQRMDGKNLYATVARLAPGESVVLSFDVTTSPQAQQDLALDQTPMGWMDPGPGVINQCFASSK